MGSPRRLGEGRHAGVLVPLFSIPSRRSWGIGEIPDLVPFSRWVARAGLDFVQILPINEMDTAHHSPYAARSAMAIDPVFVSLDALEDFADGGGEAALDGAAREALAAARAAVTIDYDAVRSAKSSALGGAFVRFEARTGSARTDAFEAFLRAEAWWLDDYTLFRALHDDRGGAYWREWPEPLRDRQADALRTARLRLARPIRYHAYVQWVAHEQWVRARQESESAIVGDFPFMVSGHSADVWARQHDFRLDAAVGTPPDASSPQGQDWGLPPYRWDACREGGYGWLRERAARCAELFDGIRVDHVVGFYRTYVRERDGTGAFTPAGERDQLAQGEAIVAAIGGAGARLIAEDLGMVPDFVRESLARLGVPGLKVLRWERRWDEPERPFRDVTEYPVTSVATTGTHDTETLAEWWDAAGRDERRQCAAMPAMRAAGLDGDSSFSPAVRDALLRGLFSAVSAFVVVPIQDVFGWRGRVNDPAAGSAENWTWRLPWPVEALVSEAEAVGRADFLRSIR